jgi:hypothetical protein
MTPLLLAIVLVIAGTPVAHRTEKPELLGPGGPDDPDA